MFARNLDDLALLAHELMGHDAGDPDTQPRARIPFTAELNEEPAVAPRFAFVKTSHWERVDTDAKAAYAKLVHALGDRVGEVELPPSARDAWDWQRTIMEAEMAANLEPLWNAGKEKLSERLRSLMERGRETRAIDYQRTLRNLPPAVKSLDELLTERYDAILTPPALGTAPKGLGATGDPAFCVIWTLFGMPAVTLPLLRGANGLPIGVQLVGRRNFDARLLRTARWLEKAVA
jgi:Asp-tRNA(Asn)/Glu-tRNA(Gln) amidotransferase A subunit family amidase